MTTKRYSRPWELLLMERMQTVSRRPYKDINSLVYFIVVEERSSNVYQRPLGAAADDGINVVDTLSLRRIFHNSIVMEER